MKDCSAPAIPRNANISNPSDTYNSGYKVTFKCNEGYNEEGISTQMCFQGKWTVLPFKCSGKFIQAYHVFSHFHFKQIRLCSHYTRLLRRHCDVTVHGDFTDRLANFGAIAVFKRS